jgi:hypothetical protein
MRPWGLKIIHHSLWIATQYHDYANYFMQSFFHNYGKTPFPLLVSFYHVLPDKSIKYCNIIQKSPQKKGCFLILLSKTSCLFSVYHVRNLDCKLLRLWRIALANIKKYGERDPS